MEENYFKLLQSEKDLRSEGRYLIGEDKLELFRYEISLLNHFRWDQRDRY